MKHALYSLFFGTILCLLSGCTTPPNEPTSKEAPAPALIGTWEMQAIHWITADTTYRIDSAQAGLFIFTPESYSIMWTPTAEARVPFEVLSQPTDEELKAGFRSIVFNGGTLSLTDSTVVTTAMVAKVPGFEGGQQLYRYQVTDDQLELTMYDEIYPDGSKPQWSGQFQTQFVMQRMK